MSITQRFGKKAKKPRKGAIPQEKVDEIQMMKPEALTVELAREQNAVDVLKEQLAEQQDVIDAKTLLERLNDEIDTEADVIAAKNALEEALEAHRDNEDYQQAKLDNKLAGISFKQDIAARNKVIKLMKKTVKAHIESGALKLKP